MTKANNSSRLPETPPLTVRSSSNSSSAWWKQSIVRRSAPLVEAELKVITSVSPFLQTPRPKESGLAFFDRSEIRTGRMLGRGGFSVVYEIVGFDLNEALSQQLLPEFQQVREQFAKNAVNQESGQCRYVIKHLQEELLQSRQKNEFAHATADLVVESAYLTRIRHDHILPLRGLPVAGLDALNDGRHDGYFLIYDRLQETLEQRIAKWETVEFYKLPPEERQPLDQVKARYALDLASALEYLHNHRIVFRDLKPQNIGFTESGRLQLFDFGLARELPAETDVVENDVYNMSDHVGTRRYMAPEVIRESRYNCKVDVYGWALVVWQMFTHRKPYAEYSVSDHGRFVCRANGERPPLPSDDVASSVLPTSGSSSADAERSKSIPHYLCDILRRAWQESVSERWTMSQVVHRLQEELSRITYHEDHVQKPVSDLFQSRIMPSPMVTLEGIEVCLPAPHRYELSGHSCFSDLCGGVDDSDRELLRLLAACYRKGEHENGLLKKRKEMDDSNVSHSSLPSGLTWNESFSSVGKDSPSPLRSH